VAAADSVKQTGIPLHMFRLRLNPFRKCSLLRPHQALERIQEILSPLLSPEELIIQTKQCNAINAWYRREVSDQLLLAFILSRRSAAALR
jgi:hypothetical protein